jgi:hypothetical protein
MAEIESTLASTPRPFHRRADECRVIGDTDTTPLLTLNAEASDQALSALASSRLEHLERWTLLLATCRSDLDYEPHQLAELLLPMVEDARKVVDALHDRLSAAERARGR